MGIIEDDDPRDAVELKRGLYNEKDIAGFIIPCSNIQKK